MAELEEFLAVEQIAQQVYEVAESIDHDWEDLPVDDEWSVSDHAVGHDGDWEIDNRCVKCRLLAIWNGRRNPNASLNP